MHRDTHFGSLNRRELHVRWIAPSSFEEWDGSTFRFSWRLLFSLSRWWRIARNPLSWWLSCRRMKGVNHRCWCLTGTSVDGAFVLFGFGLIWWYSSFDGDIPCWCDIGIAALHGCSDCGSLPVVDGEVLCLECKAEEGVA